MIAPSSDPHGSRWARNIFLVARREVRFRLRSRVFAVGTVVMVVAVAGGILLAPSLQGGTRSQAAAARVAFSGGAQALEPAFRSIAAALGQAVTVTSVPEAGAGRAQVQAGSLDLAVSGTAVAPAAVADESLPSALEIALDAATQDARMAAAGLTPSAITSITAGVQVERVQPTGSSTAGDERVVAALAVAILLFISIGMYGSFVAQGVVEEKATRIMEILLATIRPAELLAGKILGIGMVALLQLGIVAIAAITASIHTNAVSIPALGIAEVATYFAWFLLGFILYAAAYASVAALVSRQEEVQGAIAPVSLLLGGSYILMFFALSSPTSLWVTALSFVPPAAPIFMSMRIAEVGVAPWQVVLSMALTVATIAGVVWLAGRIYANSAMRIGRRVPFLEAFRA